MFCVTPVEEMVFHYCGNFEKKNIERRIPLRGKGVDWTTVACGKLTGSEGGSKTDNFA
jgi:hypothetical protein